jgi:hypothetical protein
LAKNNKKLLINNFTRSLAIFVSAIVTALSLISSFHLVFIPFYIVFTLFCLKVTKRLIPAIKEDKAYIFYLPVFILIHYLRHMTRVFAVLSSILRLPVKLEKKFQGERN